MKSNDFIAKRIAAGCARNGSAVQIQLDATAA